MNMDFAADQTPIYALDSRNQAFELSTPAARIGGWASNRTQFVVAKTPPSPAKRIDITSIEGSGAHSPRTQDAPVIGADDVPREVAVVRDRRLQLLASQFANLTTTEDDARLMLLTERLRRQVATVSTTAMQAVEAAAQAIEDADRDLLELNRLYGI
ncbi:hypothetical protein [Ralstonia pseudosolanacearum]|uniref:hypothetical protein n=1 Tax=Ralstonia pseudosolanacearum TaxID=1310165 RepID=UPI0012687E2E|nr:hypothetical protein [Ralstonia pseudosolanacearum]